MTLTDTLPSQVTFVSASAGWIEPSDVVKVTCVPAWGGVPAGSRTCAINVVEPLSGSAVAEGVRVMVDPDGAKSGTRWQAAAANDSNPAATATGTRRDLPGSKERVIMRTLTIVIP